MKFIIVLSILISTGFASANEVQLGIMLGSTSGLSGKYDLGGSRSVDALLAYSSDSKYGNYFHIDYLIERARSFYFGNANTFYLYYGPGIKLVNIRSGTDSGKMKVAFRGPIGLNVQTSNPDLELFGELAPTVDLTPSTSVYIDAGLGIRFRF